jgi:putative ABC transport system permease protein
MLQRLRARFASLRRDRSERELETELQFHLDMLSEQQRRRGLAAEDAQAALRRTFGSVEAVRENVRDAWLSRTVEMVVQDVRFGMRAWLRTPGVAAVLLAIMALGIGANTAIFSVVNGVLLRPLPYREGDRLVLLQQHQTSANVHSMGFSYQEILDYRKTAAFSDVVEFHNMWFILLGRQEPERVSTGVVSATFFQVVGVPPIHGRAFTADDDRHGAPGVLILSHAYWQRAFGGDPAVVGQVFRMNDMAHTVVGVLPPLPQYPLEVDVYMPTSACPFRSNPAAEASRTARLSTAIARLAPGVSYREAQAAADVVAARLQHDWPEVYRRADGYGLQITPLAEDMTRNFWPTLVVLLGTAGFVLLIVCASTANLLLARMVRRERELALRSALGAGRARLIRQLVTESLILTTGGGLLGLAVAWIGLDLLRDFAARFTPRATEIGLDQTVLLFALGLSLLTGLVFGSLPALSTRLDLAPSLGDGARGTPRRHRLRDALIVGQVAMACMLLVSAGLTLRSVLKLQQVDPGFKTDNILTLRVDLNFTKYRGRERVSPFWAALEDRLASLPGVIAVAGAGTFPLNDRGPFGQPLQIEGRDIPKGVARPQVDVYVATPRYFETMGIPLVAGRTFQPGDRADNRPVTIVNQSLARRYWPDGTAVGRRISGDGRSWFEVVGVVADVRQRLDQAPREAVYLPMLQGEQLSTHWLVRSAVDSASMTHAVRDAVHAIDPEQPVDHFRTLAEVRSTSLEPPRLTATLIGLFALLALVVTATGLAGVIAFSVNQRRQEFGIRMALGARRAAVLGMVLRQGLRLAAIGLALGLLGAYFLARLMTRLLFEVAPTDPTTFVGVALVLLIVAIVACLAPARRAASVDPLVALRAL